MPYIGGPKLVKNEDPEFKCLMCRSNDKLTYRKWESSDGGHEDTYYECEECGYSWWVDGIDS